MRKRRALHITFLLFILCIAGEAGWCQTVQPTSGASNLPYRAADNIDTRKNFKQPLPAGKTDNSIIYQFPNTPVSNCSLPNTFQATYTQGIDDHINDFVQSPDGTFMLVGQSTGPYAFGRKEAIVLKVDAKGNVISNNRISSSQVNSFNSIINTSEGGYIAVGNTGPAIFLVKLTSTGSVTWSAYFGNNELSGSRGIDVVETRDGGFAIAGNYSDAYDSSNIVIFKTNSAGNLQWSTKFISAKKAQATAITIAGDSLYISGSCSESYFIPSDGILIKLNASTGQHYWTKSYDKAGMIDQAVTVDYMGGTLTLGFSHNDEVTYPFEKSFTKVDLNGNVLLSKRINSPQRNYVERFLAPVADGGYVAALGYTSDYTPNATIARFDVAGNLLFSKEYTKAGSQFMTAVKQLSDGTFGMAGDYAAFFNYEDKAELIKTDANGNTGDCDADSLPITTTNETLQVSAYTWASITSGVYPYGQLVTSAEKRDNITQNQFCRSLPCDSASISPCLETFQKLYGGSGDDIAYDSRVTADNGYIVAGKTTSGNSGTEDAFIMKLNKNGSINWSKTIGGPGTDVLSKVVQTQDGYTAIGTTSSFGNVKGETFVVHTDGAGNLLWSRHYSAGGVNGEKGKNIIELSGGGYAFVTNINDSTSLGDALIARIDATGVVIWSRRFDNGGDDGFNTLLEDGDMLIAGGYATFLNRDAVLTKLNISDGSVISSRAYYNFAEQDDEMVNVEKINNGIAYSFWSRHYDGSYYINYVSCFKEREDETIFYQRKSGFGQNRIRAISTTTTPDSSFVYADCDSTQMGFGEMLKIGPTGLNEWGRDYPQGENLLSLNRINSQGLVTAGFENSYSTSRKSKILLIATDFIGRAGECGPYLGLNFVDTAQYTITPFQWKTITSDAIAVNIPISPQYSNSNFSTNTICAATVCDSIPAIADSCTAGTVIKYNSNYINTLTGITQAPDGNYYMCGTHFYDQSIEPAVVKTKPNGEVVWSKTYNQDIHGAAFIKILNTSDNNILIAGENNLVLNHGSGDSVMLMKIDYNGKVIWAKNYSRGGYSANINDIIPSDNGGFFMVLTEGWGGGSTYTVVVRIDGNGRIIWRKEVVAFASAPVFRSVTFDGKNLFIAADNYAVNGFLTIVKLDATTGNEAWAKAVYMNNQQTIIRSVETIADTVFVFYTLHKPDPFTDTNNIVMLKLQGFNGNILDNIILAKPFFTSEYLYTAVYNYHLPHEIVKTSDNNFIFSNQATNAGKTSLNMVCFDGSGKVQWLRDYPNLTGTGIFTMLRSQKELLLVSEGKDQNNDQQYQYSGGLIKTDSLGNIKITADPAAACYSTLIGAAIPAPYPYEEIPSRIESVIDAPEFESSLYQPYERDIYFKAVPACTEISNCNSLTITGKDSLCNMSDTITYTITRNTGCTAPAIWQVDTAFAKITAATDTSLKVLFRKAGSTNIIASISSGCTVITKSFNVVIMISPATLNLGPDKVICPNTPVTLNAHKGFKSYLWQDGSTDSIFIVKAPGTYYVKAINFCDAVLHDTVKITSANMLPLFIGNDTTICRNDSVMLDAGPGFTSYSWAPAYNISNVAGSSVTVWPAKDTSYTITAIQSNGCTVSDTLGIALHNIQPLFLGNDTSICTGTKVALDAGPGFVNYRWSTGSGAQQIFAGAAGLYHVTATDNHGCLARDTFQILAVFTPAVINLGNDTSLCSGEPLRLSAGPGFTTYLWSTGATSQGIDVTNAGHYRLDAVDRNFCHAKDTITVLSILLKAPINLGNDTMICQGEKILLNAGGGFTNYKWSTGETTQQIYITLQGTYSVAATNNNNCISSDSFLLVRVNALPVINLDKNASLCAGASRLLDAGAGAGISYLWQDGSTKSTFNATRTGQYWARATNSDNCIASDTTEIKELLPVPANFIYHDTAICEGLDITLFPNRQFASYLWSTGATSASLNIITAGQYWLQVTDVNGCQGKEYLNVTPKNCVSALYFPNAFTPNNDGRNDVYKPTLYGIITKFHLLIYNRFGEKVFESYDVNRGWDGWFNNVKQNSGVFTWYSEYQIKNGPVKSQKGSVTLLR